MSDIEYETLKEALNASKDEKDFSNDDLLAITLLGIIRRQNSELEGRSNLGVVGQPRRRSASASAMAKAAMDV